MPIEYDPSFATFDPKDCGKPMVAAVKDLAEQTGEHLESFYGRPLLEIANLADEIYDELPEFWRVWKDWHAPQPRPEMGDL